jgi:hypothetical protein
LAKTLKPSHTLNNLTSEKEESKQTKPSGVICILWI